MNLYLQRLIALNFVDNNIGLFINVNNNTFFYSPGFLFTRENSVHGKTLRENVISYETAGGFAFRQNTR